jgi:two-component system, chemotaxis family, response regulator Rcp1
MSTTPTEPPAQILVVEDNPADVHLLQLALQHAKVHYVLTHVLDGQAAVDFCLRRGPYQEAPRPDVLVLDLHLPKLDGFEVLERLKEGNILSHMAIIIFSTSDDPGDRAAAEALHVTRYVVKPFTLAMIMHVGQILKDVLATHAQAKHTAR